MITVLVMGSTLLFGVSRWKRAGPLLIRITVFIITSVWFRFTSFVMYGMKSYSVHEWITLKTISLFLKTVQNRGHIIWQGWMVSHYDKIGLQKITGNIFGFITKHSRLRRNHYWIIEPIPLNNPFIKEKHSVVILCTVDNQIALHEVAWLHFWKLIIINLCDQIGEEGYLNTSVDEWPGVSKILP